MSHNDDTQNWKKKKIKAGLCPSCGNHPSRKTSQLCEQCNDKHNTAQLERTKNKRQESEYW